LRSRLQLAAGVGWVVLLQHLACTLVLCIGWCALLLLPLACTLALCIGWCALLVQLLACILVLCIGWCALLLLSLACTSRSVSVGVRCCSFSRAPRAKCRCPVRSPAHARGRTGWCSAVSACRALVALWCAGSREWGLRLPQPPPPVSGEVARPREYRGHVCRACDRRLRRQPPPLPPHSPRILPNSHRFLSVGLVSSPMVSFPLRWSRFLSDGLVSSPMVSFPLRSG
jgi:hypothetical protein